MFVRLSFISSAFVARIIRIQHPRPDRFRPLSESFPHLLTVLQRPLGKLDISASGEVVAHIVGAAA
jgi:hypothetical protein